MFGPILFDHSKSKKRDSSENTKLSTASSISNNNNVVNSTGNNSSRNNSRNVNNERKNNKQTGNHPTRRQTASQPTNNGRRAINQISIQTQSQRCNDNTQKNEVLNSQSAAQQLFQLSIKHINRISCNSMAKILAGPQWNSTASVLDELEYPGLATCPELQCTDFTQSAQISVQMQSAQTSSQVQQIPPWSQVMC